MGHRRSAASRRNKAESASGVVAVTRGFVARVLPYALAGAIHRGNGDPVGRNPRRRRMCFAQPVTRIPPRATAQPHRSVR
jgi:hypothetical protein